MLPYYIEYLCLYDDLNLELGVGSGGVSITDVSEDQAIEGNGTEGGSNEFNPEIGSTDEEVGVSR